MDWTSTNFTLPPEGEVVMTKIEDKDGKRNEGKLYLKNDLWWLEDGSMYVYYKPTHWAYLPY